MQSRNSSATSQSRRRRIIAVAALAGMLGPVLFVTVLLVLTAVQYDFMLQIGWRPLADPAGAWPSGLALGPYGTLQEVTFVVSGLLLTIFSVGLSVGTTDGRSLPLGPTLLFVAGVAMAFMAFETDPIQRVGPRSLHGLVHDAAFVLFVVALLAALFSLWRMFRRDHRWRDHASFTLAAGIVAVLLLLLPGVAYYLFIVTLLAWIFVTAVRLWPHPPTASSPRSRSEE